MLQGCPSPFKVSPAQGSGRTAHDPLKTHFVGRMQALTGVPDNPTNMGPDGPSPRLCQNAWASLRTAGSRCDSQAALIAAALLALATLLLLDLQSTLHVGHSVSRRGRALTLTKHQARFRASMSAHINSNRLPRPPLSAFLQQSCTVVDEEHERLVTSFLQPWAAAGVAANATSSWPTERLYLSNDSIYLHPELEHNRLVPTFLFQLEVSPGYCLCCTPSWVPSAHGFTTLLEAVCKRCSSAPKHAGKGAAASEPVEVPRAACQLRVAEPSLKRRPIESQEAETQRK